MMPTRALTSLPCGSGRDVRPELLSLEVDYRCRLVGALARVTDVVAQCGHRKHAPARGNDATVVDARARMEHHDVLHRRRRVQTFDLEARFVRAGVPARCEHHAYAR